jgi:hypothetical protein
LPLSWVPAILNASGGRREEILIGNAVSPICASSGQSWYQQNYKQCYWFPSTEFVWMWKRHTWWIWSVMHNPPLAIYQTKYCYICHMMCHTFCLCFSNKNWLKVMCEISCALQGKDLVGSLTL